MNMLPNTAATVGNWTFQNTLADSSGNGLDFALDTGSIIYETLSPGLVGLRLDDGGPGFGGQNGVIAPLTPLLQMGGEMTLQMLWDPRKTSEQRPIFECSVGGASIYQAYFSAGRTFCWRDLVLSGVSPANDMSPATDILPYVTAVAPSKPGVPFLFTWRRRHGAGSTYIVEMFVGPTLMCSITTAFSTPTGLERLYIGRGVCSGVVASLRVDTTARSTPDIGRDAFFATSPAASSGTGIVYDGVAAAQFATALRQNPRA